MLFSGYDNSALDDSISRVDYLADGDGSGAVGTHLEEYATGITSTLGDHL